MLLPDCITYKTCSKCGCVYPATTEYFYKDAKTRDGISSACKSCVKKRSAKWRKDNYEQYLATAKRYAKEHPEQVAATQKRIRENNAEYRKKYLAQYYRDNKEHIIINIRRYQKAHPEYARAKNARRRARMKKALGKHTAKDIMRQYKLQNGKCWWCLSNLNMVYDVDHLIPLAKGGTNWPNNIVLACASCNRGRQDKLPAEWAGRLF